MTILPPVPGEPRRPHGPRDPGDAWVVAESGERYWGRFGAAGLLAFDPARGPEGSVLLQHRVSWSHFGGTWGIPGGARHQGEDAASGALREAREEAGVPEGSVRTRFTSVLDLEIWTYTTLVAEVVEPFEPVIADPESHALEWVPVAEVTGRPLHPGFADAWPALRAALAVRPVVVVDAANVVGSVPDGWWRDRAGATERLRDRLERLAGGGVEASALDLPATAWFPEFALVVEGKAAAVADAPGASCLRVVRAAGSGDDAIVDEAERLIGQGRSVVVVTSDRELAARVEQSGGAVRGARWLLAQLPKG